MPPIQNFALNSKRFWYTSQSDYDFSTNDGNENELWVNFHNKFYAILIFMKVLIIKKLFSQFFITS